MCSLTGFSRDRLGVTTLRTRGKSRRRHPSLLLPLATSIFLPSTFDPSSSSTRTYRVTLSHFLVSLFLSSTRSLSLSHLLVSHSVIHSSPSLSLLLSLSLPCLPLFYSLSLTVSPSLSLPLGGKDASQRERHERRHNFSPDV